MKYNIFQTLLSETVCKYPTKITEKKIILERMNGFLVSLQ